jgi:steroid delta-isomerase-like uncharacterized protein
MPDSATLARDYFEQWNRRNWDGIRKMMHPQYSYTGGDGKRQEGQAAGLAVAQMFAAGFPDGKIEVQRINTCGENLVVAEFTGKGTHKGELMGIAPTGRQVSMPVCNILEFRDGKVYAEREYMDMLTVLQQLGVVSVPAGAAAG